VKLSEVVSHRDAGKASVSAVYTNRSLSRRFGGGFVPVAHRERPRSRIWRSQRSLVPAAEPRTADKNTSEAIVGEVFAAIVVEVTQSASVAVPGQPIDE
jgi:hypothetical protein